MEPTVVNTNSKTKEVVTAVIIIILAILAVLYVFVLKPSPAKVPDAIANTPASNTQAQVDASVKTNPFDDSSSNSTVRVNPFQ